MAREGGREGGGREEGGRGKGLWDGCIKGLFFFFAVGGYRLKKCLHIICWP